MNFYLIYHKNHGGSTGKYTVTPDDVKQIKQDLITIKENVTDTSEFCLDHWDRIIYFNDLYEFFVNGNNVYETHVDIYKDNRIKGKKFYSKSSIFYRVISLWKRGADKVCSYTWGSSSETEWKNWGLFIDEKLKKQLEREDREKALEKKTKSPITVINNDIADRKKTMTFYTLDEMKTLEYDSLMCGTVGLNLSECGYVHRSGRWDPERKEVVNINHWFSKKSEVIGVAVCELYSVFPPAVQKVIKAIKQDPVDDGNIERAYLLFKLLNDNYDAFNAIDGLRLPELVIRGQSAGWAQLNSFACIQLSGKDSYHVYVSHGASDRSENFSDFEDALNYADRVFRYLNCCSFNIRLETGNGQLEQNSTNKKAEEAFVTKYKKDHAFKKKKSYTYSLRTVRSYYNDGCGKETKSLYKTFYAHSKTEAYTMVTEYIKAFNDSERGYRPGWVGHKHMTLGSKTPEIRY